MSTKSTETGHTNNVANFQTIISKCVGLGDSYNPSNPKLRIATMQESYTNAANVLKDVQVKITEFKNALNDRKVAAAKVKPLATRVLNALKSLDLRVETINNAKTVNRKIQGRRATPVAKIAHSVGAAVADENQTIPKTISASHQGIDQVISNFSQLIEIVKAEHSYAPNETELTTQSLEAFYNDLQAKNRAIMDAETNLNNARIARDKLLYTQQSNIVTLAQGVKSYIKSAFGATSPEYKSVSAISVIYLGK
jgi:hypothetical protein